MGCGGGPLSGGGMGSLDSLGGGGPYNYGVPVVFTCYVHKLDLILGVSSGHALLEKPTLKYRIYGTLRYISIHS